MQKKGRLFIQPSRSKMILFIIIELIVGFSLLKAFTCMISSDGCYAIIGYILYPISFFFVPFLSGSGYVALAIGFLASLIYSYLIACFLVWIVEAIILRKK